MQYRTLGQTGWKFSWLSFGASSLGQEFRNVDVNEALRSVRVALDGGMNFIDTSPFYGRGMSECLLGVALRDVPRDSYYLGTKLGRYSPTHFDFSAKRVEESVEISLQRMGVEHLDIVLCHDLEFVEMQQIVDETLPALRKLKAAGKVRAIGISGYPMKMFRFVLDQTDLVVQPLHAAEHDAGGFGAVLASEKGRHPQRRAIFGAIAYQRDTPQVAQGHPVRARDCRAGGKALRRARQRHRETRTSVFAAASRDDQLRCWLGEPGECPKVARLGR
jgi:hypothetical protein